jgi:hypothetical protein
MTTDRNGVELEAFRPVVYRETDEADPRGALVLAILDGNRARIELDPPEDVDEEFRVLDRTAEAEDLAAYAAGNYDALDAPASDFVAEILEVDGDRLELARGSEEGSASV